MPFLQTVPVLKDRRVTVMGLGLFGGGVGVSQFLCRSGARVTVTDTRPEKELAESMEALKGLPVTFHLDGHRDEDFTQTDLLIINPAVPLESPFLKLAEQKGVPLESEMNLFFKLCPARIVGITGSNGKTTTTALIGEILKRGPVRTWVGGNIGRSLLGDLSDMTSQDTAVLELSSFQLDHLAHLRRSPSMGIVMNVIPNHLDRHGTMKNYIAAKRNIIRFQTPDDWMVLNADDPVVASFRHAAPGQAAMFSMKDSSLHGFGAEDTIRLRLDGQAITLDVSRRLIPGGFNLQNMIAASLSTGILSHPGWSGWRDAAEEVLNTFPGVEHRLELVGEFSNVRYYNDSIATNPDSTLAALDTLKGPIILIAGGYDKNLPFDTLAARIRERVKAVVLIGQTRSKLKESIAKETNKVNVEEAQTLEEAVRLSIRCAAPGETVLLSPACASYGMFRNYVDRGRQFKECVRTYAPTAKKI